MVYHAGDLLLDPISEQFHGPVNDILICRDLRSPLAATYLLLLIHDRACVKTLLPMLETSGQVLPPGEEPYLIRFTQNELLGFVFPYREERRFLSFAPGQLVTPILKERACIDLVMACLSSPLPYPLLYLVLIQECIHLGKDGSVYFLPTLDLSALVPGKGEAACVSVCAELLLSVLEGAKRRKPLKSFELLRKKLATHAYSGFPELYHDIKVTAIPESKARLIPRLKGFWRRNKDRVFYALLCFCILVVILTLLFLLSQLIFGDIPFLRFFQRSFEVIGTETLP